jgi:hypothetical protein
MAILPAHDDRAESHEHDTWYGIRADRRGTLGGCACRARTAPRSSTRSPPAPASLQTAWRDGAARPCPARPQAARPAPGIVDQAHVQSTSLRSNPGVQHEVASSRSLLDDTMSVPTEEALFHCSPKRRVRRRSHGAAASNPAAGSGRCSRSGCAAGSPGARARPPRRGRPG